MPDWLVTTLWIVGAVAVVFVVGGLMLPRKFEIARSIVIAAPPAKIHPHIDSFDIHFTYSLEGDGTRVTWTDRGTLPAAPHWRWMGLLIPSMLGKSFDKGLASLKRVVETSAG